MQMGGCSGSGLIDSESILSFVDLSALSCGESFSFNDIHVGIFCSKENLLVTAQR